MKILQKTQHWFFSFFMKRTLFCLIIIFVAGLGISYFNFTRLSDSLIRSQSLQNSRYQANAVISAWQLYSNSAANRLAKTEGVKIRHDYALNESSIPPPATFVIELGKEITKNSGGAAIDLSSDLPYPWRQDRPSNEFADFALNYFRQHPTEGEYYRIDTRENAERWLYAQAVVMGPSCVSCHNTHPESPKKDWKVGDIRGVLSISYPLDQIKDQTSRALSLATVMLATFSLVGVLSIALVVSRLAQSHRVLEQEVKERTLNLAETNRDLEKRNALIRQVFGRYLSDEIVTNLLESPQSLKLGGERRKITILASDLRGFTALSEKLSAEEVISVLNIYLESMAGIISEFGGVINDIIGDGILVLFGAPMEREDDPQRAIACALKMQLAMKQVNDRLKKVGFPPIEMGIGVNSGFVVLGNIGSERRSKYGIVGSEVNLTYRIESFTTGGQIVISESTFEEAKADVLVRRAKKVKAKGVKESITIYEISGIGGEYNVFLPNEDDTLEDVSQDLAIECSALKEKELTNEVFTAKLLKVSEKSALLQCQLDSEIPPVMTNIKMSVIYGSDKIKVTDEVYGKIMEIEGHRMLVRFTGFTNSLREQILVVLQKTVRGESDA